MSTAATASAAASTQPSLTQQLAAITAGAGAFYEAKLDQSELAVIKAQFSPDKENPYPVPAVGSQAPQFTLSDHTGRSVSLSELVAAGEHVILIFYRGEWCPYCAATLKAYNARVDDFTALKARLFAITPTVAALTPATVDKFSLTFPVLSDPGNAVAKQYGALNQLSEDLSRISTKLSGLNFEQVYGDSTHTLPHPGTFVIEAGTGKVAMGVVEMDYRKRVEPQEVVDLLKTL